MTATLPLFLRVPLQPDEPPSCFAARLAARNFRTAREFAADMGLRVLDIANGCETAVTKLADLGGVSAEALTRSALRRAGGVITLKGQVLHPRMLSRARARICPKCLQEDIAKSDLPPELAVHNRANWMVTVLRTCPLHNSALVELDRDVPARDIHDWTQIVAPIVPELCNLAARAVDRPPSGLESYLNDRLAGHRTNPWLDGMEFFAVGHVAELVGAVALFGKRVNLKALGASQRYDSGHAGFEILRGGKASLGNFMSTMKGHTQAAKDGPQVIYGKLYTSLAGGLIADAFEPIRTIMSEHILAALPLGPGDMLFGKPVLARRWHSIRTASLASGINPPRLRRLVAAEGFLPDPSVPDNLVLFGPEVLERIQARQTRSPSLKEVETYLSAGRDQISGLLRAGLIRRHNIGQGHQVFFKDELDRFLERLHLDAEIVAGPRDGILSIAGACKQARCRNTEIVRLILDRKLRWVGRSAETSGYASVVVDIVELKSRFHLESFEGHSIRAATTALRTSSHVMSKLIDLGAIEMVAVVNPVTRRRHNIIRPSELLRFQSTYVSLCGLGRERDEHPKIVLKDLNSRGVQPAAELAGVGATFYRRDDLNII